MPSFNEITGARISSGVHVKGTDKEAFASGWDAIWGKKEAPVDEATIEEFTEFPVEVEYTATIFKPDAIVRIEKYLESTHDAWVAACKSMPDGFEGGVMAGPVEMICDECGVDRIISCCENPDSCGMMGEAQ